MEALIVTLGLVGLVVILLYKYLTWNFDYFEKLGLPGPKPRLLYGTFPSVITGERHVCYEAQDLYNEYKDKHRAIGVFLTRNPQIMVLDPQLAHEIMVTNFHKFHDNIASKYVLNPRADKYAARNPFFACGELWKTKRIEVVGGLTPSKLNLAYPIWKDGLRKLNAVLQQKTATGNAVIETKDLGYRYAGGIMADFLWGIDTKTFEKANEPNMYMQMAMKLFAQAFYSLSLFYKYNAAPFLRYFFNYRVFLLETDKFFDQLTQEACAMRQQDKTNVERADYLSYILQLQQKRNLSNDDVTGSMLTALLDGYETTGTVLFHTLFYLAKYPHVQEKLRAEIMENLGPDGYMSFETLHSLPYMDQCVHETIRMITPIDTYTKICTENTEIRLDNAKRIPIKVGTQMVIPIFAYHHDPEYFPEPYTYNPDRFDNGRHSELNKLGVFMPFGDGPRICAGMRLGLFTNKTALVDILKQYRIKSCAQTMAEKKPDTKSFIFGLEGDFWLEYERL